MKIGELAKRSGLSTHTIRYYEQIGLLPYAGRNSSKQRDYDASILIWIEFLGRLKTTGMPIREMLRYAALRGQRPVRKPRVGEFLERHREHVRATWPSSTPAFSSSTPRSTATSKPKRG